MEVGTGQFLRVFFIAGALACTGVCVPLQAGSQPVSYDIV